MNIFDIIKSNINKKFKVEKNKNNEYIYKQLTIIIDPGNEKIINNCVMVYESYAKLSGYIPIEITFILENKPKKINYNTLCLTSDEFNTGYTIMSIPKKIVIYRNEEVLRVILHEFIHAFEYDKYFNTSVISGMNKFLPFEAYTEFWAEILFYYIMSLRENINFNNLINEQIFYTMEQIQAILYKTKIKYCQDTPVFHYYFYRVVMLIFKDYLLDKFNRNLYCKCGNIEDINKKIINGIEILLRGLKPVKKNISLSMVKYKDYI